MASLAARTVGGGADRYRCDFVERAWSRSAASHLTQSMERRTAGLSVFANGTTRASACGLASVSPHGMTVRPTPARARPGNAGPRHVRHCPVPSLSHCMSSKCCVRRRPGRRYRTLTSVPTRTSSCAIRRLTAGCWTFNSRAARVKLLARAAASKARSSSSFGRLRQFAFHSSRGRHWKNRASAGPARS